MKCNYCGKELEQGADFCPECGMIISLDGTDAVKTEPEKEVVPEYTPNIFKTIDFEQEEAQPAMELEVTDHEEQAPVVEAIPEYTPEIETEPEQPVVASSESIEQPEEMAETGFAAEEFAPPEYKSELSYLDEAELSVPFTAETPEESASVLFGEETVSEPQPAEELAGDTIVMSLDEIKAAEAAEDDHEVQLPIEDNSLIEALFDASIINAKNEEIEDITKAHNEKIKKDKKKSSSNKGYATVFALVVVLVGIIFAAGYVVDNVLPKIQGETTTVDSVNGTTEPLSTLPTTVKPAYTTAPTTTVPTTSGTSTTGASTTGTSTTGTSTTGTSTTGTSTTGTSTTAPSTTGSTTTTVPSTTRPTTTAPTTTQSSSVKEPSRWNMDGEAYFPTSGSVSLKAGPSSSASTVVTHPYGYPLYAYASENGYYYVESPYHDHLMAWVSASSLKAYVTTTATTRPSTTKPSTTSPSTTSPSTTAPDSDDDGYNAYDKSYSAVIAVDEGLNVRKGPGTSYGINGTIPLGHTVIVYGYSTKVSGWVYVETDSNYPAAALSGWVLEEYLG